MLVSAVLMSLNLLVCDQISHTFFDAPGAQAATFVEGKQAVVAPQSKPYVTMVFCGPADYKVCALCVPHP